MAKTKRKGLRPSSPWTIYRAAVRGNSSQRVTVGLGLILVGVGLVVTLVRLIEHWQWLAVMLVGWLVCELGSRELSGD